SASNSRSPIGKDPPRLVPSSAAGGTEWAPAASSGMSRDSSQVSPEVGFRPSPDGAPRFPYGTLPMRVGSTRQGPSVLPRGGGGDVGYSDRRRRFPAGAAAHRRDDGADSPRAGPARRPGRGVGGRGGACGRGGHRGPRLGL